MEMVSSSEGSTSGTTKTRDIDGLLAGVGYKVRSSELHQVAENIERLENAIVNSSADIPQLASDTVHYDPSNIGTWVDTLLSEFDHTASLPYDLSDDLAAAPPPQHHHHHQLITTVEEDSGIRLVHMLLTCADSLQRGDFHLAGSLIENMQGLLAHVSTNRGIGKVAGYFIDALTRRVLGLNKNGVLLGENDVLYYHYYEACPYLKFAHFTANQAILEAFNGHDCVHVIDFNLMQGLQWPALIQALALRPGGPPFLRLTGIGPPSSDDRDTLREIGLRLADLARSVNVRFAFRGVAAWRLEDVKPWMLQVSPKEAVAVNSIMQLHRLLGSGSGIEAVLGWIQDLNPKIMTVVEQEANHNEDGLLERFTEALHYYSTVFDSLEGCPVEPDKALAEMYLQREICNVVCCEGTARVERHEPLAKWRERLGKAGFRPVHLGSNAFKQASMLLTLFSSEGYCVEEKEGCLTLGWHSRPLIAASAWQVVAVQETEALRLEH